MPETASRYSRFATKAERLSLTIPNASTQGPPTSSAVRVNPGVPFAVHRKLPPTELEARLHPALPRLCGIAIVEASDKNSFVRAHQSKRQSMHYVVRKMLWAGLLFVLKNADGATLATSCRDCHPSEYQLWASSHHGLAERAISVKLDRSSFEPPRAFKAGSQTNEIRLKDGQCQIVTLGFKTNVEAYAVDRVIGVEPVRQFLTTAPKKRPSGSDLNI
jgi:hypothetical protein